ncbi:uncharacterized protein LOC111704171 [Eurytemora carolleeae]|uniref:uncharacterized protein LOC111704171 n=1 Tax=Eurytemora carolleeae TaxID=1294199 RepID=UPI000C76BEF2|nr:uncharacterized protein LOC111704171 [Eurytemora carolleeae]|eukprot:XP_023332092.1 uncharacterized protein LOC111704171 [Eurytemora affinis]
MSCQVISRRELNAGRNLFLSEVRSSSPEAWRRTIYASPKHMRRRNVYDKTNSFWKLVQVEEDKSNLNPAQNIDILRKKVSLFGSAQSILSTPGLPLNSYPSPRTARRLKEGIGSKEARKIKVGSLCSEHNWSCVENQRSRRLGFIKHTEKIKVVEFVDSWDTLCLEQCCKLYNSKLFSCTQKCCWRKERKSEKGICIHPCCANLEVEVYDTGVYTQLNENIEPVLGFLKHGHGFRIEDKLLYPVNTGDDLCLDACCLYDNMLIFEATDWRIPSTIGVKETASGVEETASGVKEKASGVKEKASGVKEKASGVKEAANEVKK